MYLDGGNLLTGLMATLNNSKMLFYKEGNIDMTYSLGNGLFRIILSGNSISYFSQYESYILHIRVS